MVNIWFSLFSDVIVVYRSLNAQIHFFSLCHLQIYFSGLFAHTSNECYYTKCLCNLYFYKNSTFRFSSATSFIVNVSDNRFPSFHISLFYKSHWTHFQHYLIWMHKAQTLTVAFTTENWLKWKSTNRMISAFWHCTF